MKHEVIYFIFLCYIYLYRKTLDIYIEFSTALSNYYFRDVTRRLV